MKLTRKSRFGQILVWLIWFLVLLVALHGSAGARPERVENSLALVLTCPPQSGLFFPWLSRLRWRKWALAHYQAWQERCRQARGAYHHAVWAARLARLALQGLLPFATVIDWLIRTQLRRQLGALPVLYTVLKILNVRAIVNRHCPQGGADIDHGAVAPVLILNRLTAPRPLYQIADWLAQTSLVTGLGIPATKFNDDRLGRTLAARQPHLREIWFDVVHRALVDLHIDLRVIFYDLTAFVCQGQYRGRAWAEFGFAHNTPMGKRKFKAGLNVADDGRFPLAYDPWPGSTADTATVQENLERLTRLLARHGYPAQGIILVGDRANLNDELALAYERQQQETGLSYLAGLEARKTEHRTRLEAYPESYFQRHPLQQDGCYGIPCEVPFEHEGQQVVHRGLIVLSRPMQHARRQTRAAQLRALFQELTEVTNRIGRPYYRTVAQVQERAETRLRNSPVGTLVETWAFEEGGRIRLRWQVKRDDLQAAMRHDGRYLLVTNHPPLSPDQMLQLYRDKDACEKCFTVCKQELRVSPIYLHQDQRIESMLLLQMVALLTYNVLERQARQHGLVLTTRRLIATLESLTLIETHCWDGSVLVRLTPVSAEQAHLLQALAEILETMRWPHLRPALAAPEDRGTGPSLSSGPPWEKNPGLLAPAA